MDVKGASCTSTRGVRLPRTPSRTTTWQCATRHLWRHLTITSLRICSCLGVFWLRQCGLSDHIAVKHRWYCLLKMQMDAVLLSKQLDSDTVFPGRMTFHTAFVDPIARPDAPEREIIECRAFLFFHNMVQRARCEAERGGGRQ